MVVVAGFALVHMCVYICREKAGPRVGVKITSDIFTATQERKIFVSGVTGRCGCGRYLRARTDLEQMCLDLQGEDGASCRYGYVHGCMGTQEKWKLRSRCLGVE